MNQSLFSVAALFIVGLICTISIFFYYLFKSHNEWKTKLKTSPIDRMFGSREDFIKFYSKKGYSNESIEFIYENTQKFLKANYIVLLPTDNLIDLYERDESEWLYIISKWFEKLGREKPTDEILKLSLSKYKQINFEYLIELFDNNSSQKSEQLFS